VISRRRAGCGRSHETSLVVRAALIGTAGALVVAVMSAAVAGLHMLLFGLAMGERLSSQLKIESQRALPRPCWSRYHSALIPGTRSPANYSATRSRRGDCTCAARPSAAPPKQNRGVVVEADGEHRPTEAHSVRRYAEESEQWRREDVGDI
jgi:hypothetical protein